jgi:hypothetical protein
MLITIYKTGLVRRPNIPAESNWNSHLSPVDNALVSVRPASLGVMPCKARLISSSLCYRTFSVLRSGWGIVTPNSSLSDEFDARRGWRKRAKSMDGANARVV